MRERGGKEILAVRDNMVGLPRLTEPCLPLPIASQSTGQAGREGQDEHG